MNSKFDKFVVKTNPEVAKAFKTIADSFGRAPAPVTTAESFREELQKFYCFTEHEITTILNCVLVISQKSAFSYSTIADRVKRNCQHGTDKHVVLDWVSNWAIKLEED